MGECEKNPTYMDTACTKTCGKCAMNKTQKCKFFETEVVHRVMSEGVKEEISRRRLETHVKEEVCTESVSSATTTSSPGGCADTSEHCAAWAESGECDRN